MKGLAGYCRRCSRRWWQTSEDPKRACPFCGSSRTIVREADERRAA